MLDLGAMENCQTKKKKQSKFNSSLDELFFFTFQRFDTYSSVLIREKKSYNDDELG